MKVNSSEVVEKEPSDEIFAANAEVLGVGVAITDRIMKSFKEYIQEENMVGFQGAGLSSSKVPYDIDDLEVKNKVNAILGHTAVSEFMGPKGLSHKWNQNYPC